MGQADHSTIRRLSIRTATLGDLLRLNAIAERAVNMLLAPYFTVDHIRAANNAKMYELDPQLVESGTYYVCEADGLVVGGSGWSASGELDSIVGRSTKDNETAAMRSTYVDPDWSRLGIASLLARTTETAARLSGYQNFETMCTPLAAQMRRALGYETVGSAHIPCGPGLTAEFVLMRKEA